ncbi:hypothetical protein RJ639_028645, partial [Escallonia herrerae]
MEEVTYLRYLKWIVMTSKYVDNHSEAPASDAMYQFTQQSLPACKPVLTPPWVITTFFLVDALFIPIGLVSLHASQSVVEIVDRYDSECVPDLFKSNKVVHKHMKAPIFIYYQLDNYYQNYRRYGKSRSDQQLVHGLQHNDTSSCTPEESSNGLPIVPCGLIAWSLFNDTYSFSHGTHELRVKRKDNGTLIGGGKLDLNIPLSDQEDLIVWMHTAALPSFRKLYGRIEEDLNVDDVVVSFGGTKKLVLSTSSWLGGRNTFLGMAYTSVGSSSILVAFVFLLLHVRNP